MSACDAAIVRSDLSGYREELNELLTAYFVEADELAMEHFGDELSGLNIEAAVDADLDRLASARIDEPLVLAETGDGLVGCVQLKRLAEATAEVKRLYVRPSRRGEGIGRALMDATLEGARDDGFRTLRLGVAPYLERAQSLYQELGFEFRSQYDKSQTPDVIADDWCFMELSLGP